MTDRFDAQLRQHLLGTADERAAAGQLESIVDAVAVTPQRQRVVARLTWLPGRLGSDPTRSLRYALLAAALVGATAAAALLVGGSGRSTAFEGTWTSTDFADGSTQYLVVGPGLSPAVQFIDDYATGLACRNDPVKYFTADGHGVATSDRLVVTWPNGGGCGLLSLPMDPFTFTWNETTDRMVDGDRLTWTRVPDDAPPPTAAPAPERTPSATAAASADCVQFDAPGTYSAAAGSMTLTVVVPATETEPWLGRRDGFHMLRAACTDESGQGLMEATEASRIATDGCAGVSVAIESVADAVAAATSAKDVDLLEENAVTVDGYSGSRLDMIVRDAPNDCLDGQVPLAEGLRPFDPGLNFTLYLIDVEGRTLVLALYGQTFWDIPLRETVDAIVASMEIDPGAVVEPTASTALPTVEPRPAPTEAPTAAPDPIATESPATESPAPATPAPTDEVPQAS